MQERINKLIQVVLHIHIEGKQYHNYSINIR